MKSLKIILSLVGILVLLFGVQVYRQSLEPNPYIWDEDGLKSTLTTLGATAVTVDPDNRVTVTLGQPQPPLDTFQGELSLIPGEVVEQKLALQSGFSKISEGVFVATFNDGEQQMFRTSSTQTMLAIKKAMYQLALQLINGITLGGVYAMIAIGYTLVYGVLQMINFAHGEIFMFGSFGAFFTFSLLVSSGKLPIPWVFAFLLAFVIAMTTSAILAVIVERVAYRPLRQAPRLTVLISAIGTSIFLQNAMMLIVHGRIKYYPNDILVQGPIPLAGGIVIEKIGLMIIVISLLMMAGLYTIIQKTKTGKAIRAVAEDKPTAALMGINVNKIIVMTFLIGSSMAGAGGIMVGLRDTQINHMMGFIPGIKAFTAAVVGGIGNIPGAMLGGFFLGIAEAMGAQFMPGQYKDIIAFTLLIFVLIFRPNGIMGEVLAMKKM